MTTTPRAAWTQLQGSLQDKLQLAVDLRRQGYYDMSRQIALELCGKQPQSYSVWHTLGQTWTDSGEFDKALQCCERSYALLKRHGAVSTHARQFQTIALALAQARMRFGMFDTALELWEAGRLGVSWEPWPGTLYLLNTPPNTLASGSRKDRTLLVQAEGGYGDLFMCMRWLPRIKEAMGVTRLGLMIWPALTDFCDWKAHDVDTVYVIGQDNIPFGEWKYSISIMSMPAVFGMQGWGDIPPSSFMRWSKPDAGGPLRIGFCWRAEENASPVRTKSLPLETAETVCDLIIHDSRRANGIEICSLSPEKADLYSVTSFAQPAYTKMELEQMTSWRATADYICSMDFVLTVDTAVAHLCGLLGIPALVLLPRSSCWRWDVNSGRSHWYGAQLTCYRQPVPLVWDAEAIVKSLMERIDASAKTRIV